MSLTESLKVSNNLYEELIIQTQSNTESTTELPNVSIYTLQQRSNEDISFHISLGNIDYYIVCDGHGASNRLTHGHVAYTIINGYLDLPPLHQVLQNDIKNVENNLICSKIEETFKIYDQRMRELKCYGGSCICMIIVINKKDVYLINLGDSRGCIWNSNGILLKTRDHGVENEDELKRVEKSGGFILFGRLLGVISVFRAFGNWGLKCENNEYFHDRALSCIPEIQHCQIEAKASAIITSDALRDVRLNPENLAEIINKIENKKDIAKTIVECVSKLSKDITMKFRTTDDISVLYIDNLG